MNVKTVTTIMIAIMAIGLTGLATAMDTNVQYNGDGSYTCNYDARGTGYIGIHTYTSDGSDHLMSGWTNTKANGCQQMDTYNGPVFGGTYSGTVIDRSATVGGAAIGEDESGYIMTITTDNVGNRVYTYANYHDNRGWGSHVTTDQIVVVGSLVNIGGCNYNVTGVAAVTEISGFAYGDDTTISGFVRTETGDEYTYAYLQMDNGRMNLYTLSAAGSVTPDFLPIDGACGQLVMVDNTKGIGTFVIGVGTDMHGMDFTMTENGNTNTTMFDSVGTDEIVRMTTTFNGEFDATGYVYAIDLTDVPPAP